ncbi:MAG TPA: hypothetical protein VME44_12745 [Streptosporangiaceae bacterium]|nr:hypothetical protein [Streptosporangiaceae bacterium]
MRTAPPVWDCECQQDRAGPALVLPGRPWAVRLAGGHSACPALEIYSAGVLLDVVSSTRLDAPFLRGTRETDGGAGPCALAWGRLPMSGAPPEVEFSRGRMRPTRRPGTVLEATSWCWLAIADGSFDRVAVRAEGRCVRAKIRRGRH